MVQNPCLSSLYLLCSLGAQADEGTQDILRKLDEPSVKQNVKTVQGGVLIDMENSDTYGRAKTTFILALLLQLNEVKPNLTKKTTRRDSSQLLSVFLLYSAAQNYLHLHTIIPHLNRSCSPRNNCRRTLVDKNHNRSKDENCGNNLCESATFGCGR